MKADISTLLKPDILILRRQLDSRSQVVRSVDQYISRLAISQESPELTPTWESGWFPV